MAKKTIKISGNVDDFIEELILKKSNFEVTTSTGLTKIETEKKILHFTDELTSNKILQKFSKLKSQIENSNIIIDDIPQEFIYYYNLNTFICDVKHFYQEYLFHIDISGAYPRVLLNEGLIELDFYNDLMQLNKKDRLKVIGMLAAKKYKLIYRNGEIYNIPEKISGEKSNYFYYVQLIVDELMKFCINILGEDYLFYWVDGIYFRHNDFKIRKIEDFLEKHKYDYHYSDIYYFKADLIEDKIKIETMCQERHKLHLPAQKKEYCIDISYKNRNKQYILNLINKFA